MDKLEKNILVVDDSRGLRQFLKIVIGTHFPHRVDEAEDGDKAVSQLIGKKFDLVITDINMPGMDGFALIRKVRDEIDKDLPIIIITTKGKDADRDTGLAMGANSYITKPIDGRKLIDTVSSLIVQ